MARLKAKYNKAERKSGLRSTISSITSDNKTKGKIPKNKAGFKVRKKK